MRTARDINWTQGQIQAIAKGKCDNIRANIRAEMDHIGIEVNGLSAISGVSVTTIRDFLRGTDSGISKVIKITFALGLNLAELEKHPDAFASEHLT